MLQILLILLFIGLPLFVLITYMFTRTNSGRSLFSERDIPLVEEEVYKTIPLEFLRHLRFSVRYSPVKKKFGSGQNYVYLEEQLRYDNIPLTDWLKHDVPIRQGSEPSPQMLRRISLLKQYVPNKPPGVQPRLEVALGAGR